MMALAQNRARCDSRFVEPRMDGEGQLCSDGHEAMGLVENLSYMVI